MPKFNYRQEAKIITTETTEFFIEATSQQEADQTARTMTGYNITERDGVTLGNTTTDCNANQLISPKQNGGLPTLKILRDDDATILITNAE